jgi:hypothetical protein
MQNRVNPVLADLEAALKRNRIGFLWRSLLGAGGLIAG